MNTSIREKIKGNEGLPVLGIFCIVALGMILLGTLGLHVNVVSVCLLIVLEAAIAVVIYHAELWIHGVLILLEIIEGILLGRILLVLCCIVVYVAAIITLQAWKALGKKQNNGA